MLDYDGFILFVALNSAILLVLAINVSRLRIKHQIAWGDGGNKILMKAIRVHANGVEQVPVYALIILALTFVEAGRVLLSVLVMAFTLARITHAYGILCSVPVCRQIGAGVTYLAQAVATLVLLAGVFSL